MSTPGDGPTGGGDDDAVGYGKPPLHTRFRKGQSGNPRGRPRGAKTLAVLLREVLDRKVAVDTGGRRRNITKREAILTNLVDRSAKADLRATRLLLDILRRVDDPPPPEPAADELARAAILAKLARLAAAMAAPTADPGPGEKEE